MKLLLDFLNRTRLLANAGESACDLFPSWTWANEFVKASEGDDTWVQLSPYGRFPNVQGLQVFTPRDAKAVAGDFVANARMALGLGLPWYVGHPDHPLHKERYKDTSAYGRIKSLEARSDDSCVACKAFAANSADGAEPCREHGLFARVRFNHKGKDAIANEEFHGHSVNWRLRKVGNEWHPFSLKSVGFTNEPNIPVPAITHANEELDGELLRRRFCRLSVERLMANEPSKKDISEDRYKEMKNSFGPWEGFDACLLHMTGKQGYDEETAKKVCGRLQADLGESANSRLPSGARAKAMARMRRK